MNKERMTTSAAISAGETIAGAQYSDRKRSIPYRPEYNQITGSVEGSILLQQLWFRWCNAGRQAFYKYRQPCPAEDYREGDSWSEELGFTGYQFDRALKAIGTKITTGVGKEIAHLCSLVIYWTDSNRKTWYELNERLFFLLTGLVYNAPELLGNYDPENNLGKYDLLNYLNSVGLGDYIPSDTTPHTDSNKNMRADAQAPVLQEAVHPNGHQPEPAPDDFDALFGPDKPAMAPLTASFTATDLKTPEGRDRALERVLAERQKTREERYWLSLEAECPTLARYAPGMGVDRDAVLRFIYYLTREQHVPLDTVKAAEVRFWLSETESLLRLAGGDYTLLEAAAERIRADKLTIKSPKSLAYAVSAVVQERYAAQHMPLHAGGDGSIVTPLRRMELPPEPKEEHNAHNSNHKA